MERRVGVCSWSLRPTSPEDLARKLEAVEVDAVQLALEPIRSGRWTFEETVVRVARLGVEVRSVMMEMAGEDYSSLESIRRTGGVRADEYWPANRRAAEENARLARRFGVDLVTFHAGFFPHERDDPERGSLIDRLREVVDRFADEGVRVALETGQETAGTLLGVLEQLDRPDVGVNFDPANMILYGMGDPIGALETLAPCVRQAHVKDARRAAVSGAWGTEHRVGDGEVDWRRFLDVLNEDVGPVDLMIEREAGEDRIGDIQSARRRMMEFGA